MSNAIDKARIGPGSSGVIVVKNGIAYVVAVGANGTQLTADSGEPSGVDFDAAGGSGVSDGDKGDITVTGSGTVWTIDNDVVTYAKIQNVTDARLLGRSAGSSGDAQEITVGAGLSLAAGALTATGGVSDGDKGDITVTGSGATWTIDPNVVTFAKFQQVTGPALIGRAAGTLGNIAEIGAGADGQYCQRIGGAIAFTDLDGAHLLAGSVALAGIQNIATARILGRDTAGTGVVEELTGAEVGALIALNQLAAPSGSVAFNDQQATSFRVENRTSDPGSPTVGQIWLRTDL